MTQDEVLMALERAGVHWPRLQLTAPQLAAWRDALRPFDLSDAVAVLDDLRATTHQRWAPDPGLVLAALRSLARRRAANGVLPPPNRAADPLDRAPDSGGVTGRVEAGAWLARCRQSLAGRS